jgi:phage N-6-adenine-methyltransferase
MQIMTGASHSMRGQDEWGTPASLFKELDDRFHFTLDPCATPENAKCAVYFTKEMDGLQEDWSGTVFMNPPFSRCQEWVAKAWHESLRGVTVVCLLPARVDTDWWHRYVVDGNAEIAWIRGRVKYDGGKHNAPFSSVIVIFHPGREG